METTTKNKIKNYVIFTLIWLLFIAMINLSVVSDSGRKVAKEKIELQESLQKIKDDPITIYTKRVRYINEAIDEKTYKIVTLKDQISVLEKQVELDKDKKFCSEIQLNRAVNFEEVDPEFCNSQENIEKLKK